jgi:hypothetical protein
LNGRVFQLTEGTSGNYTVYTDKINSKDNWGGKVKLTYASGAVVWTGRCHVALLMVEQIKQ